jgi:hypothetical protein
MIFPGRARGEEGLLLHVAYSAIADAVTYGDAYDRDDGSADVGPFRTEMDWDDWPEVQIEEGLVLVGAATVEVELERDGDDVAYRVLGFLGEVGDAALDVGGLGCTWVLRCGSWRLALNKRGCEQKQNRDGYAHGLASNFDLTFVSGNCTTA